jgi:RimJ/RimL family protein N-acetyltransferase
VLRDVVTGDLGLYRRLRCDPAMMSELGGPLDPADMPAKLGQDVQAVLLDRSWVLTIVPDAHHPARAAGSVVLWQHSDGDPDHSEVGWMVLPEYQGRGLATAAMAELLGRADADGRWGDIHAYPGVTNTASNALCRRLGFQLVGRTVTRFADRDLETNRWTRPTPH